jgi:hypothetical protein
MLLLPDAPVGGEPLVLPVFMPGEDWPWLPAPPPWPLLDEPGLAELPVPIDPALDDPEAPMPL